MAVKYGLYEADETPRRCKCGSAVSTVVAKWFADGSRRRKRKCECGNIFITQTVIFQGKFIKEKKKDSRFI